MVHPYLRRRQGLEQIDYPSEEVREILGPTLGIPIFQEQLMQLAMACGGFTADDADQLRRALGSWKKKGQLEEYQDIQQTNGGVPQRQVSKDIASQADTLDALKKAGWITTDPFEFSTQYCAAV